MDIDIDGLWAHLYLTNCIKITYNILTFIIYKDKFVTSHTANDKV